MSDFKKTKKTYLFLVSFGCHSEIISEVKEMFRYYPRSKKDITSSDEKFSPTGISNFFLLEYFLIIPNSIMKKKLSSPVFPPFYERIIRDSKFLPDWYEIKETLTNSDSDTIIDNMKNKKVRLYPRNRELEKHIIEEEIEATLEESSTGYRVFNNWKTSQGNSQNPLIIEYPFDFSKSVKQVKGKENIKCVILEQLLLIYPFYLAGSESLKVLVYPIASNKIFYGYIIIGYHPLISSSPSEFEESLNKVVGGGIKDLYLPALVLCHNSFYENQVKEEQIGKEDIQENIIFYNDKIAGSNSIIERKLHFRQFHLEVQRLRRKG